MGIQSTIHLVKADETNDNLCDALHLNIFLQSITTSDSTPLSPIAMEGLDLAFQCVNSIILYESQISHQESIANPLIDTEPKKTLENVAAIVGLLQQAATVRLDNFKGKYLSGLYELMQFVNAALEQTKPNVSA